MLKTIQTKKEYRAALARAYELLQGDTIRHANELDKLGALIAAYELIHYPVKSANAG